MENRYPSREVLEEIARLKRALHQEGERYVPEPEPPGMWSRHGGKRWQHMSPEERAALREHLRKRKADGPVKRPRRPGSKPG